MARPKHRKEKKPVEERATHLPVFGAEAALGPASRMYRSPMEAYSSERSAVSPSQLDADVLDETDAEGAETDGDSEDEATGELGSEVGDDGDDGEDGEDGEDGDDGDAAAV